MKVVEGRKICRTHKVQIVDLATGRSVSFSLISKKHLLNLKKKAIKAFKELE